MSEKKADFALATTEAVDAIIADAKKEHCGRGICSAPQGHDGTCEEASGWAEFDLRMVRRFPDECTEEVSRKGEAQPCGKPAVAARMDTDADRPYPVCAYHSRAPMVPLTALLTEGARR